MCEMVTQLLDQATPMRAGGQIVATTSSAFNANYVSSGNPPNEHLPAFRVALSRRPSLPLRLASSPLAPRPANKGDSIIA